MQVNRVFLGLNVVPFFLSPRFYYSETLVLFRNAHKVCNNCFELAFSMVYFILDENDLHTSVIVTKLIRFLYLFLIYYDSLAIAVRLFYSIALFLHQVFTQHSPSSCSSLK